MSGVVKSPSRMSWSSRETLPDVQEWWKALTDNREWSGDSPGCPGVVRSLSQMSGVVRSPSRMSWSSRETLRMSGSGGRPLRMSGSVREASRMSGYG